MSQPAPLIPDYSLLRPIGRGGYGEVWLARSVTGVFRAVKIVRRATFEDGRPFEREFEGIRRFEPVSVGQESQVALLHVGRNDEAGFFYYVMEAADDAETGEEIVPDRYVPKTLKHLRDRNGDRRLPAQDCLNIGLALARALSHLHDSGLVHRDIKPSNVIFVHGVPKLADIGLVSAIDTSNSFVGTEGFVPPEGPGSAEADLFGLGKVLYEISTGRDRHDFPDLPHDLDQLPDRRLLLELNEIVLRACDPDRSRRYSSAQALHEDLILVQAGRSVRRLHLMERRLRLIAKYGVATSILTAISVAGFVWAAAQSREARLHQARAEQAEQAARDQLSESRFNWVRANRLTGRPGQQLESIATLAQAATRSNQFDLRNEAIACLLLPDVIPRAPIVNDPRQDPPEVSRDGTTYGTNDALGNWFVRDFESHQLVYQLPTQGQPLARVVTSPDGSWTLTIDKTGQAHLWAILSPTHPAQTTARNHPGDPATIAAATARPLPLAPGDRVLEFTPDGRSLAIRRPNGELTFLDTKSLLETAAFPGFQNLTGLILNPNGDRFLFVDRNTVHIHRRHDGSRVCSIEADGSISAAAWHPNGRHVALAWAKHVALWNSDTVEQRTLFAGHGAQVVGLQFSPTGDWLISASWDRTTRFWLTDTGRPLLTLPSSGNKLHLSQNGRRLSFSAWDKSALHSFELPDQRPAHSIALPRFGFVANIAFNPDGKWLALITQSGVHIYDPLHPTLRAFLPITSGVSAAFDPSAFALLHAGPGGLHHRPLSFDPATGQIHATEGVVLDVDHGAGTRAFYQARTNRRIVAETDAGRLVSLTLGPVLHRARPEQSVLQAALYGVNPDGTLAISFTDRSPRLIQVWSPTSGQLVTNLPATGPIRDAAFSPDGLWLAISTPARTEIRSVHSWTSVARFNHPPSSESRHRLTFSPDARLLAVAGSEDAVWLLDVSSGIHLASLPTEHLLSALAFHPAGDKLAMAFESGSFQIWDLARLRSSLARLDLDWTAPASSSPAAPPPPPPPPGR